MIEDEIGTIVGNKGKSNDNEAHGNEPGDQEVGQKTTKKTNGESESKGMGDMTSNAKGRTGSQGAEGDETKAARDTGSGRRTNGKGKTV